MLSLPSFPLTDRDLSSRRYHTYGTLIFHHCQRTSQIFVPDARLYPNITRRDQINLVLAVELHKDPLYLNKICSHDICVVQGLLYVHLHVLIASAKTIVSSGVS